MSTRWAQFLYCSELLTNNTTVKTLPLCSAPPPGGTNWLSLGHLTKFLLILQKIKEQLDLKPTSTAQDIHAYVVAAPIVVVMSLLLQLLLLCNCRLLLLLLLLLLKWLSFLQLLFFGFATKKLIIGKIKVLSVEFLTTPTSRLQKKISVHLSTAVWGHQ